MSASNPIGTAPGNQQTDATTLPAKDLESQSKTEAGNSEENVSAFKSLGWLDRLLALWIFLAMLVGILLGNFVPSTGPSLQKGKFVGVSVPIGTCKCSTDSSATATPHLLASLVLTWYPSTAVGLLVMMYPILCKVRYEALHKLLSQKAMWIQICFSIFINWVVAPFLMVRLVLQLPTGIESNYAMVDSSDMFSHNSSLSPGRFCRTKVTCALA